MAVVTYGGGMVPHVVDTAPADGTDGTLAGSAERDDRLLDALTGWTYKNGGTKASPLWQRVLMPQENSQRVLFRDDFLGGEEWITLDAVLMDAAGVNQIPTTGTARAYVTVPRSGILTFAEVVVEDALATHADNHVTFTIVNRRGSGSGSTAMLTAGSAYNTTDVDVAGAVALSAKKPNPLRVSGSPAVNAGDVLEVLCTVGGTLGGAIDGAVVKVRIQTLSRLWTPRVTRTAGAPTVISNSTLAGLTTVTNGNAYLSLSGTNEAQYAGMDWGMRYLFAPNAKAIFEARIFIGTNPATNSRICVGLSTALQDFATEATWLEQQLSRYTYDPTALMDFAWFKLNASMALLYEAKAGSSSSLAQETGLTLSTSTWYTLTIDFRDLTAIRFLVDGALRGTISMAGLTGAVVPNLFIQKDSGTNAPTLRVDYVDCGWNRS